MRTVWKFDITDALDRAVVVEDTPVVDFNFPLGSVTMDVQVQHGRAVFWVDLYDQNDPMVHRFAVIGTGHRIPTFVRDWEGTWQDGGLVWHLYAVDEELYQLAIEREAGNPGTKP